jgi:hypothetical protein
MMSFATYLRHFDQYREQGGFRGKLSVYRRTCVHLATLPSNSQNLDFTPKLVTRNYWATKPDFVSTCEIHEVASSHLFFSQEKDGSNLSHRLKDQYPRHDRIAREMALEKRFVDRYVLDPNNTLSWFHLFDTIDEKERIAVRENLENATNIGAHSSSSFSPVCSASSRCTRRPNSGSVRKAATTRRHRDASRCG